MLGLIFQGITSLAGWSWSQMLVLYGVYNLWWGVAVTFFNGGLNINWRVRRGNLDKILLWPGKAFFYASMRFEPELLVHFLFGLVVLVIALVRMGTGISLLNFLVFSILMLNSWALVFFVSIIFGSTAFWFTENSYLTKMFWVWESLAKYPAELFAPYKLLYWAIHSFFPVVFLTVLPAKAVLGQLNWFLTASAFLVTGLTAFLARMIWRTGLKRYSGVSV